MKKIILFLTIFLLSVTTNSQDFKYFGPMNKKVFSKMTASELVLYHDCLKSIGEEFSNIEWVSDEITQEYIKNKRKYKTLKVTKNNVTDKISISGQKGISISESEKYIIHIDRKKEKSIVEILVVS